MKTSIVRALMRRVAVELPDGSLHVLHVLAQHRVLLLQLRVVFFEMSQLGFSLPVVLQKLVRENGNIVALDGILPRGGTTEEKS